jgi:NitT/TauT family transport system ATP-binding protein
MVREEELTPEAGESPLPPDSEQPPEHLPAIRLRDVSKSFGKNNVLDGITADIEAGQIVAFVGPSGCGKSTLLNCIVGTLEPTSGSVEIWDSATARLQPVTGPGRDRGIVYQRYSLFPHLNALHNVAFGLKLDETSPKNRWLNPLGWRKLRKEHLRKAEEMLVKVGLGDSLHKYPGELSGGMCQRVAIAQALVMRPKVLLMDEPFGALDETTRESLQRLMLRFYQENLEAKKHGERPPHTVIIVTHEIEEAIYVGDRIIGLSQQGRGDRGAALVYDERQPIYHADHQKDHDAIARQKEVVLKAAFDEQAIEDYHKILKARGQI